MSNPFKAWSRPIKTLLSLPIMLLTFSTLSSCDNAHSPNSLTGYIEADYRFVATPESGWLLNEPPPPGQQLALGEPLFLLDQQFQTLALQQAQNGARHAEARLANLQTGKRSQELDSLRASRAALQTKLTQAQTDAERFQHLFKRGAINQAKTEAAMTKVKTLSAQIAAIAAEIKAGSLPARDPQIAAARADLSSAHTGIAQAEETLARRQISSRIAGRVEQRYRHQGEFVRAGELVLKILPSQARKVIFFAPETDLAQLRPGKSLTVNGDGIAPQTAKISFINDQVSYTPPVIYSETSRSRLVYRVEAKLSDDTLPIGLPVNLSYD